MNDFRAVLAIFLSFISGYLVFDLCHTGFSWKILIAAILGFMLVHVIWPPKGSRDRGSAWYEALQFIFDLPYQLAALSIRGLGKII